jgi:hypothetical protein
MEARDRLANIGIFGLAAIAWLLVGLVVTTRDPRLDPGAAIAGSPTAATGSAPRAGAAG